MGFSSIPACNYDVPTTQPTGSSSSSSGASSSTSSSGNGGAGGSGQGGMPGTGGGGGGGGDIIDPTVHCGAEAQCTVTQGCCTNQIDKFFCSLPFSCTSGQPENISVDCDGAEDCPGTTCCGQWDEQNKKYSSVNCQLECAAPNLVICHLDSPKPGCIVGTTCVIEKLLGPGYGYCK